MLRTVSIFVLLFLLIRLRGTADPPSLPQDRILLPSRTHLINRTAMILEQSQDVAAEILERSMAAVGSAKALAHFFTKMEIGTRITISVLGGSISTGAGIELSPPETFVWANLVRNKIAPNAKFVNGALPATGSAYFHACWKKHIPADSDLVLLDLAVNDAPDTGGAKNMETLLRSLLSARSKPAIILVAFGSRMRNVSQLIDNGAHWQAALASVYDIPMINWASALHQSRSFLRSTLARDARWGHHFDSRGHEVAANMVLYLLQKVHTELQLGLRSLHSSPFANWSSIEANCYTASDPDNLVPLTKGWDLTKRAHAGAAKVFYEIRNSTAENWLNFTVHCVAACRVDFLYYRGPSDLGDLTCYVKGFTEVLRGVWRNPYEIVSSTRSAFTLPPGTSGIACRLLIERTNFRFVGATTVPASSAGSSEFFSLA